MQHAACSSMQCSMQHNYSACSVRVQFATRTAQQAVSSKTVRVPSPLKPGGPGPLQWMGNRPCARRQPQQPAPEAGFLLLPAQRAPGVRWVVLARRLLLWEAVDPWRWERLVVQCLHLRKVQRIFAYTGQFLQLYPDRLRNRLSRVYPKIHG